MVWQKVINLFSATFLHQATKSNGLCRLKQQEGVGFKGIYLQHRWKWRWSSKGLPLFQTKLKSTESADWCSFHQQQWVTLSSYHPALAQSKIQTLSDQAARQVSSSCSHFLHHVSSFLAAVTHARKHLLLLHAGSAGCGMDRDQFAGFQS